MRQFFKNLFTKNWQYKILAIIMAIAIGIYVSQMQNPNLEKVFSVPLETHNLAAELTVAYEPETVKVRLSGSKNLIESLSSANISAFLDLNQAKEGQTAAKVQVSLPDGFSMVSISPDQVTAHIETINYAQHKLELDTENLEIAPGYISLKPNLNPSVIDISGSASTLSQIARVYVAAQGEAAGNYTETLPVQVADAEGNLLNRQLTITPSTVAVFLPVVAETPAKQLPVQVPLVGAPKAGYTISYLIIEPAVTTAFGSYNNLASALYINTTPLDITDADGDIRTTLPLIAPDGLEAPETKQVNVIVKIEPILAKEFKNVLVQLKGAETDVSIEPSVVSVKVSGPKSLVNSMNSSDIKIYADFGRAQADAIPLEAVLPANVVLDELAVETVSIKAE